VKSNFYQYYTCTNCYTSQLLPFPTKLELEKLYNQFHLSEEEGGSYDWVEERMKADFLPKIILIKRYKKNTSIRLLDVGCGKGYFIKECQKHNIFATGLDISDSGIQHAKNSLKVDARQMDVVSFSQDPVNQNNYDVITLWATIEHLPNPKEVLDSIFSCLKPGGLFFLDTGLGNDVFEKFLLGHSQWYDAPQHIFVYSIDGLKILFEQVGFKILKIDKNFERNYVRRLIKYIRHLYLCLVPYILLRVILGKKGFGSLQQESKWPLGKLLQIIAIKNR